MPRTGRPSSLTPAVRDRFLRALRTGLFRDQACVYAGISTSTFYRWMEKGNADPELSKEPDLDAMPLKTLRQLAKDSGVEVSPRAGRPTLIRALSDAGIGSWQLYRDFAREVELAEVECELGVLVQWREHMANNPAAIEKFLARRFRSRWESSAVLQITGDAENPIRGEIVHRDQRGLLEAGRERVMELVPPSRAKPEAS